MFIRAKMRRRTRNRFRGWNPGYVLNFYLTKSVRVNGKPRQKSIKFLASLPSEALEKDRILSFVGCLAQVLQRLAAEAVSEEEIGRLMKGLDGWVPLPSQAEIDEAKEKDRVAMAKAMEFFGIKSM